MRVRTGAGYEAGGGPVPSTRARSHHDHDRDQQTGLTTSAMSSPGRSSDARGLMPSPTSTPTAGPWRLPKSRLRSPGTSKAATDRRDASPWAPSVPIRPRVARCVAGHAPVAAPIRNSGVVGRAAAPATPSRPRLARQVGDDQALAEHERDHEPRQTLGAGRSRSVHWRWMRYRNARRLKTRRPGLDEYNYCVGGD